MNNTSPKPSLSAQIVEVLERGPATMAAIAQELDARHRSVSSLLSVLHAAGVIEVFERRQKAEGEKGRPKAVWRLVRRPEPAPAPRVRPTVVTF